MQTLLRVLAIGFAAVIALMSAAGIIGVGNARSSAASAAGLVRDQLLVENLLDEMRREQDVLNQTIYSLARNPNEADRLDLSADLDQTDKRIAQLTAQAANGPNADAWNRLQGAVLDFSAQARLFLKGNPPDTASRDLFLRHEVVTEQVAHIVDLNYARAVETRTRLDRQTEQLTRETEILLGGCLLIALICALVTVRIAARVFKRMEEQTGELSRVSFRLLETQESTARRFAHELHDELGGSLTAIRSNLMTIANHANGSAGERAKIDDCVKLVDQSISNVRELSQLLRPTILDDFGLDAGLRWLAERFGERAGVEVDYRSEFNARLPDETETHLFRIVQEALTNVARHAAATKVSIYLRVVHAHGGDSIRLTLKDNGQGFGESKGSGLGLNGMRARARSAGGEFDIKSERGQGVTIEVTAPIEKPATVETA